MLCRMRRRLLQSMRSTSTASDRLSPRHFSMPSRWRPAGHGHRAARRSLRTHAGRASTGQDQIGFRRTGDHPLVRPARSRPEMVFTPNRLPRTPSVVGSSVHRLERPVGRDACAPFAELTRSSRASGRCRATPRVPAPACFRETSAAKRPAQAGRAAQGPLPALPRERERDPREPKVSSVLEEAPPEKDPARCRARPISDERVDLYPQVVPSLWKVGPRLSFTPRPPML